MIETVLIPIALAVGFFVGYLLGSDHGFLKGNVRAVSEGEVPLVLHPSLAPVRPKPGHISRPNPEQIANIKKNAGTEYPPDMIRKDWSK